MAEATATARPVTAVSRTAALLSFAGAAMFVVLVAALHFIKPGLDPSWRMISEYEIGDYGWIMVLAFLSLSFSYATLFAAIRSQVRTTVGRVGLALLLAGAIGTAMAGIFTPDPITATADQLTMHGNLHGVGALIGIPTFPVAATLISRALARNQAWSSARRSLLWAAGLTWVGLVGFAVSMAIMFRGSFNPDVLIGWPNRFLMLTYCGWLMTVAWHALRLSRRGS